MLGSIGAPLEALKGQSHVLKNGEVCTYACPPPHLAAVLQRNLATVSCAYGLGDREVCPRACPHAPQPEGKEDQEVKEGKED